MKPFNNWNDVQATTERPKLPMGGYVCKILNAEVITTRSGSELLKVSFDIFDGEYKDFYKNDYRSQNSENKYWKGFISYFLPLEDGSEKDNWTKSKFKAFINAVEESNRGYHWDWNESGLKDKSIGMITRNEEWEYEGKTGFRVKPYLFIEVERIKKGNYTLPNDKYLNGDAPAPATTNTINNSEDFSAIDDDLPFD